MRLAVTKAILLTAGFVLLAAGTAQAQWGRAPVRDASRTFRADVVSWKKLKQRNVVMQKRDYSCGAASLATVLQYFWGDSVTEEQLLVALVKMLTPEELVDRLKNGLTLTDLRRLAVRVGYQAAIGRLEMDKLHESKVPLIVGITYKGYDHFVVYRGTDGYFIYLADPIRGNIRIPFFEFEEQWQKNLVLAVAKPGADIPETSALSVRCDEIWLGELNKYYLRKRLTAPPRPLPYERRP